MSLKCLCSSLSSRVVKLSIAILNSVKAGCYTITVMHVVEPHQFKEIRKKKPKKFLPFLMILLLVEAGVGIYFYFHSNKPKPASNKPSAINTLTDSTPTITKSGGKLKQFTGEEFKTLYRSMIYPNTQQFSDPPPITGNIEADNRIRGMAEARGYHLTSIPIQSIVKINEPRLEGDDLLQPLAAQSWFDIKAAAKKAGLPLTLISAYRSPEYQRNLFTSRLYAHGVTATQVAAAQADQAIQDTLTLTALPGYSRHHTGYTVDMWCEDGSATFLSSSCYRWISANNYEHAKEYGWIPSYPADTKEQGPEPEPWEYVWVGSDRLTE